MKLDMHCHVREGSFDCAVSFDEYITILKSKGFHGMVVTDHNSYRGYRHWKNKIKGRRHKDFVVLKGIEYDTKDAGHMIAIMPEIAFIDSPLNNPDVNVLRNKRQEVAQVLANSIFQFFGISLQNDEEEVEEMRYNTIKEIEKAHNWAVPTIQKLMRKGFLQGDGKGNLDLTRDMMRIFVVHDRAGMYDR